MLNLFVNRLALVGSSGLEPLFAYLLMVRVTFATHLFEFFVWWAQVDSNHRPHAYQACALTT